ncbi:MAG: ABC transporter ATP-binding protein [Bacteroidota bacterium]
MSAALVLDRVTKRYGQGLAVLDGFSHTFAPGTTTALVGPNGSGKSTLLRLLMALAFPTSGTIRYGDTGSGPGQGLDVHKHPYRYLRHVGIVHDAPRLPQHLTAVELLEWVLRQRGQWDDGAAARVEALLDTVLLDERRTQVIGTYSSGMLRKTQLAAALVAKPSVLLMDEPFRGLDTAATVAALDLVRAHIAAGGLAVLSSHRADLLDVLADETVMLGRVAETVD